MLSRSKFLLLSAVFAVIFQVAAAGTAHANYFVVTAGAVCDTSANKVVIEYWATSFNPMKGFGLANPQIDILLNDVKVAEGALAAPDYAFSGTVDAPAGSGPGDAVTVTALAAGFWEGTTISGGSASVVVNIPVEPCNQPGLGRFTGGGHQIMVDGVRVTRGLTIHCDLLLSNNLEVNWNGNQFHMTEHLTTVACTDDPDIIQAPPPAPLDTLIGIGTGRYNGVDGFTIQFTLVDGGEPGTMDQAALYIFNSDNVVLNVPLQYLSGGNLQAHYDQPHK